MRLRTCLRCDLIWSRCCLFLPTTATLFHCKVIRDRQPCCYWTSLVAIPNVGRGRLSEAERKQFANQGSLETGGGGLHGVQHQCNHGPARISKCAAPRVVNDACLRLQHPPCRTEPQVWLTLVHGIGAMIQFVGPSTLQARTGEKVGAHRAGTYARSGPYGHGYWHQPH